MAMLPANSSRRRWLLPLVMWVLFGASVASAALLARYKSGLWSVNLAAPASFEQVEIRLPSGWQVAHRSTDEGELIQARETAAPGRSLKIQCTGPDAANGPLSFLMSSGLYQFMTLDPDDVRQFEQINVPDGQGIIIHPKHTRGSFAVLTFEDGRAVTVQMSTRGSSSASDDAILYHVATSIRLRPLPEPATPARRARGDREI